MTILLAFERSGHDAAGVQDLRGSSSVSDRGPAPEGALWSHDPRLEPHVERTADARRGGLLSGLRALSRPWRRALSRHVEFAVALVVAVGLSLAGGGGFKAVADQTDSQVCRPPIGFVA